MCPMVYFSESPYSVMADIGDNGHPVPLLARYNGGLLYAVSRYLPPPEYGKSKLLSSQQEPHVIFK
jgi:hypothetical protein